MRLTRGWSTYWENRKIDWKTSYQNWDHPHRYAISAILNQFNWGSLLEVGVGGGANLINIVKHHKNKQLGGVDLNKDAIELASKTFQGALFKVNPAHDIMLSDNSVDVVLSDMCLIYYDPTKIDSAIREMKRIGRNNFLLCEFHSTSLLRRLYLWYTSGYHAYDYKKLLEKHGLYDIQVYKIPEELWPGGQPQKEFAYFIIGKIPKRK